MRWPWNAIVFVGIGLAGAAAIAWKAYQEDHQGQKIRWKAPDFPADVVRRSLR